MNDVAVALGEQRQFFAGFPDRLYHPCSAARTCARTRRRNAARRCASTPTRTSCCRNPTSACACAEGMSHVPVEGGGDDPHRHRHPAGFQRRRRDCFVDEPRRLATQDARDYRSSAASNCRFSGKTYGCTTSRCSTCSRCRTDLKSFRGDPEVSYERISERLDDNIRHYVKRMAPTFAISATATGPDPVPPRR